MTKKEAKPTAQIFQFPKKAEDGYSTFDPDKVRENIIDAKIVAVEESLDFITEQLFVSLTAAGYRCDNDYLNTIIVAMLRGVMHEHFNLPNPLVDFLNRYQKKIHTILDDQLTSLDIGSTEVE